MHSNISDEVMSEHTTWHCLIDRLLFVFTSITVPIDVQRSF